MNSTPSVPESGHDSSPDPKVEQYTITPELAGQWLESNTRNRNLRDHIAERLADAIRRGEWRLNGDTIRFDNDGLLLDGQHRLEAIRRSGVTVQSLVVFGVEASSQVTVDTGTKRTFADVLKLRDETRTNTLASALRLYWRYENGVMRRSMVEPTNDELLVLLEDCPTIRRSVEVAEKNKGMRTSRSIAATAHFLFSQGDEAEADWFFGKLYTGAELGENSPILRLREFLQFSTGTNTKYSNVYRLALYCKAWNCHIEGRGMKQLRWRAGGSSPEAFPFPVHPDNF